VPYALNVAPGTGRSGLCERTIATARATLTAQIPVNVEMCKSVSKAI
jgi:hypothetical protein